MKLSALDCCVLNGGGGAWAFEPLARRLSSALGIGIAAEPRCFNHVDRDLGDEDLEGELDRRVAGAFWRAAGSFGGGCSESVP